MLNSVPSPGPATLDSDSKNNENRVVFDSGERRSSMQRKTASWIIGIALVLALLLAPYPIQAQQVGSQDDGIYYAGSFIFSLFYFPLKLVSCVGTQVLADTAYIATYQVPGNYEGGTNGKQIGEVALGACTGSWVIRPDQVKKDYQ